MSDHTPTVGELQQAYVEASGASMAQESYYAEQVAEFERGIARIKAEALRDLAAEVADALKGGVSARQGSRMQYAIGLMTARADQIGREAGR